MRVIAALVAVLALFAAASVPVHASSVTFITAELSAAEENDFAVESEADAAADEEEADEEYAKAEGEELNEVVDEAAQPALLEVEDAAEETDEAEDEAEEEVDEEDAAEDELDAEVDAIDEDAVEEENADVFVETMDAAGSVLEWLNKARAADAEVLKELERRAGLFQGKLFVDGSLRLMTNEGVSAVNGAIKAMKAHKKVAALTKSAGLTKAAAAHVADIGPKGGFSHTGTDGSSPFDRMNRFGKWSKTAAENMGSGSNDGKSIVMQLLIDDGVSSRGHRTNILNGALTKVGIAVGSHKVYKYMTVMDFAGAYAEKK